MTQNRLAWKKYPATFSERDSGTAPGQPSMAPRPKGFGNYEHILVPTNFDPRERPAVMLALQMALACQAKVTLLHVLAPAEPPRSTHWLDAIDNLYDALSRPRGQTQMAALMQAIESTRARISAFLEAEIPLEIRRDLDIRTECRSGETATEVARFADENEVDLMILSSDRSTRRFFFRRQLSKEILRLARQPVILVHPHVSDQVAPGEVQPQVSYV